MLLPGFPLSQQQFSLRQQMLFEMVDGLFGTERFAGEVGGTVLGAAAAFGTGVEVQKLLPGKFLDPGNAIGLHRFVFQVQFAELTQGPEAAAEDIGNGAQEVQVLGKGDIDQKAQNYQGMAPPEKAVPGEQTRLRQAGK